MGISFGRLSAWNSSHLLEEQSHHQERDVCKDEMEMGVSFPQGKLDQMLLVLTSNPVHCFLMEEDFILW